MCVLCKDMSERDVSIYITTNFYTDRLVDGFWTVVIGLYFCERQRTENEIENGGQMRTQMSYLKFAKIIYCIHFIFNLFKLIVCIEAYPGLTYCM